jgi:hypothetical protein
LYRASPCVPLRPDNECPQFFAVDWREDDAGLVAYCAQALGLESLTTEGKKKKKKGTQLVLCTISLSQRAASPVLDHVKAVLSGMPFLSHDNANEVPQRVGWQPAGGRGCRLAPAMPLVALSLPTP